MLSDTQSADIFPLVDREYDSSIFGSQLFGERICPDPGKLAFDVRQDLVVRNHIIRGFLNKCKNLFFDSISGITDKKLTKLLLNDSATWIESEFYDDRQCPIFNLPRFFRTDETSDFRILEIQAPGSGWGDLELLRRLANMLGYSEGLDTYAPVVKIVNSIIRICGSDTPTVFHMLDNSSNPSSMRYLMRVTAPPIRYWGYDPHIHASEIQLIRSHSVRGLMGENLFRERVKAAKKGNLAFDLPPLPIFDQKLLMCLPFLRETRHLFSDVDRSLFVHTSLIESSGFVDKDGSTETIERFLRRPRSARKYFLKYAGCDTNINWGSRAVFRLDGNDAERLLARAQADVLIGRPWLIQPEVRGKEVVEFFDREQETKKSENMIVKQSCFYSEDDLVGVRAMYRRMFKVHGQNDTVVRLWV